MEVDLLYLAKPKYGGWVTFTAHLIYCLVNEGVKVRLYKAGKITSSKAKQYGYGLNYYTISPSTFRHLKKPLITAIDKNFYDYIPLLRGSTLVIHDPTELKGKVLEELKNFKIITIRRTVRDLLENKYGIKSNLINHPFYKYPVTKCQNKKDNVSISRIDFDKHTDIILKANKKLENPIYIYGAVNRLYEYFSLEKNGLDFRKFYNGTFDRSFNAVSNILSSAKFMVDMSAIKNDGGGTQYTFLEAIHNGTALLLNDKWFENGIDALKPNVNCYSCSNSDELVDIIKNKKDNSKILKNAELILNNHVKLDLNKVIGN